MNLPFLDVDFISSSIKSFTSAEDIAESYFQKKLPLFGRASHVDDGDTFKFVHEPFFKSILGGTNNNLGARGNIDRNISLSIRLSGIDCPETGKPGKPGQPFGEEAKNFLKELVANKRKIKLVLLQKDQYGRLLCMVYVKQHPLLPIYKNVSLALLEEGLACVYKGQGSDFHGQRDEFMATESWAKQNRKGVWSIENFESPGAYKRKHRDQQGN